MGKRPLVAMLVVFCVTIAQESRAQFCPGVSPWVFDDILASDPFCGFITKIANQGVTLGCDVLDANHRLYCPNDSVSRKQMAAFMARLGDALFPLTCAAGQVLKWNGAAWTCANDNTGGGGGGGTVTSVATGTGLVGSPNPITASGSINLAASYQLPQGCSNGQVPKSNGSGGWTCAADAAGAGTVTSVTATAGGGLATSPGGGITGAGSVGIATGGVSTAMLANGSVTAAKLAAGAVVAGLPDCLDGQVIRRVGGAWVCHNLPPAIMTLDSFNRTGQYTSMAIGADGAPVISYNDTSSNVLRVAKCLNAACVGVAFNMVDGAGSVGLYNAIAVGTDGNPVISYYDSTNANLKVAKCGNADCTSGNIVTLMDSMGAVGQHTAIAIGLDGAPVISYYDVTNQTLKVAKCTNAFCTGASTRTTVDSAGAVGLHTSIAIGADGNPVMSYHDQTNGDLKVAKCVNPACPGSATRTTVDSAVSVGTYTSIAIGADGNPVISYTDSTNSDVKVAKCANAACTGSATVTTIDGPDVVGSMTSIAVAPDGMPIVSYQDFTHQSLKVAKCANAACSGSALITTLDGEPNVGLASAIAIGADGFPVVIYQNGFTSNLKLARCSNAACLVP